MPFTGGSAYGQEIESLNCALTNVDPLEYYIDMKEAMKSITIDTIIMLSLASVLRNGT